MENNILQDLKNFDNVWMRVSEYASDPVHMAEKGDEAVLKAFIEDESKDLAFYIDLACKCRAPGSVIIRGIAADERRHLKILQTEYFLLTGDSCVPSRSCPYTDGVLSALRKAYIHETEENKEYLKASEETKNPRLGALYEELAADEKRHLDRIRKLIEISMQ